MRKHIAASVLTVLLLVCFLVPAFAQSTGAQLSFVTDQAGLFSETQRASLEQKAASISRTYNLGVYIITLNDFRDYTSSSRIENCVNSIYSTYHLGLGADQAGTVLLLSMKERDYCLDFYGSRADRAFTETGRDRMEDRFLSYFRRNDFYGGFNAYLETCAQYLQAAQNGTPVGQGQPSSADRSGAGVASLILGGLAALVVGLCLCAPMRSAGQKRDANQYTVPGSLNLRRRSDMFLHRSVTRRPRQTDSSSHSGHSGSRHYSSGGHSGRSGKF